MAGMRSDGLHTTSREYLQAEVAERARHGTAEEVRTTCSFARAERLLGREYHGRFLIELLQNAADAWRSDPRSASDRSRVAVIVGEGPALLVANQGAVMTPEVVIESLGHIGASTKSEGEAIGHKGIGFKSVLEITLAPEIYSGLQEEAPGLAVSFDPQLAKASIVRDSPRWDELLTSVQGLDPTDELSAVPILRFPHWVDELPKDVARLADDGFDTVVRLPFDRRSAQRLGLDEGTWLTTVRDALNDVSDQILLLLGCFSEVRIEDRLVLTDVLVRPEWDVASSASSPDRDREEVRILRDGQLSSTWWLFRRTLPTLEHLAGEVAVGLRCVPGERSASVVPAVDGGPSAPFHLFFPTRIASGLPFLLHGYFEVDAARTGFYRGSTNRNRAILDELAMLVAEAVRDAAEDPAIDLATMVDLIATCDEPEDALAREFRELVLSRLDRHAWIPVEDDGTGQGRARPHAVFVTKPELTRHVGRVFSPAYLSSRVQLGAPAGALTDRALELIASRQPRDQRDLWEILSDLCRPGAVPIWQDDAADRGFRSLLDLLDALEVEDRTATAALIEGLRGDPDSRLLPTSGTSDGRQLLPVPDPGEGVAGRRSRLVMARARATKGEALVPPEELDLAFLPEGLLASEADIDRAKPLGVRPFTVDNVLDRLNGIGESGVDAEGLLRFLWRLLTRERASGFGTKRAAERAAMFDPSQWFWCRPGRAREDETSRLRQQRERYLADVPVPCRDGEWRRAGSVGFGADWAEWLESGASGAATSTATRQRVSAYRALEAISPGHGTLLASPALVLGLMEDESFNVPLVSDESEEPEEMLDEARRNAERHAFLLRLGVWEVPPVDAFESRDRANRSAFPWSGPIPELQQSIIAESGGWTFGLEGWGGHQHHNVYLAEDYRFTWSLEDAATRNAEALATGLRLGTKLYADRLDALVFCPQCKDPGGSHSATRQSTTTSGYPSCLALQLQHDPWVACTLDGSPVDRPVPPVEAWWRERPPVGAGLRQSPWRLLPLCGPASGVTEELRRLAGINTIGDADLAAVGSLLKRLRKGYEQRSLAVDPASSGSARQAFVGLHRLAYERMAELSNDAPEAVAEVFAEVGVLCDFGDGLVYRAPGEARHDDGRFSTYVRHFVGTVPFLVLPRDQEVRAARIGVPQFFVRLARRGGDDGEDVTDELRSLLADRIPELLAIVVNHSLGTQTLELSSLQFEERARRLQALTVRQTPDLVIDASIEGSSFSVTLGEGSDQDVFLENPTSPAPVLFHDLSGDGWQDRLRRKIAPHLAAILENSAYSHTFALFLQAETDAEREEFLLELGISGDEAEAVAARIGVVGEEERQRHIRWYHAILNVLGHPPVDLTLDDATLVSGLRAAGLEADVVRALIDAGGGEAVRREFGEGSPLRLLNDGGVDLASLDTELRRGGDAGLTVTAAKRSFARWIEASGRRVSAVLATRLPADVAKSSVRALEPPALLALSIDPPIEGILGPVADLLASAGLSVPVADLALDPAAELVRVGGFESVEALDADVLLLYDEEEQRRVLRERAAQWRREIRVLAVLIRMGPAETRSTIRALDDCVGVALAGAPSLPSDLAEAVGELFVEHVDLRDWLADQLDDSILGQGPDRDDLLARASALGVAVDRLSDLLRALDSPRRDQARAIKDRSERLHSRGLVPAPPAGLKSIAPTRSKPGTTGRKKVTAVKVGESHDRRKRELGDEGEQWALAAIIGQMLRLSGEERERAIDAVSALFARFEGSPVDAALSHAALARSRDIDEEELIDELTGLLHVSRHSDAFGFDLVGWLPLAPGSESRAVCLEVKSSSGEGFHLSSSEWALAQRLHDDDEGDRYAVLAVRRGKRGGVPSIMDLLVDPVSLFESGQLRRDVDGYKIAYRTETEGSMGHNGSLS